MSNLDSKAAGRFMFLYMDSLLLYLPNRGLAAANIDVLEFNVVVIPALAIEIVCCYIA